MGKEVLGRLGIKPGERLGRAARVVLALLALAAGEARQAPSWAVAVRDSVVRRVELRSDVELENPQETLELIAVRPGEPLRDEAVRQSLRNLHAAGEAGEVEARLVTLEDGLQVTFALWGVTWVEEVRLEGTLGLRPSRLRKALPQGPDQPLLENRVLRGLYQLEELYRSDGYLNAEVRLEVDVDEARKRAIVTYRIDSRQPAIVESVELEGDLGPVDAHQLRERLQASAGKRFREEAVRNDAERMENWLLERGYRQAVVESPRVVLDEENRAVTLTYPVAVGPQFVLEVNGVDDSVLRKKELLPLQGRERFDEAALLQAEQAIRSFYQERGHYRVRIERTQERIEDLVRIRLAIDPGPVYELEAVRIGGNQEVASGVLEAVMATSPRRTLFAGGGRLVEERLEEDLDRLRSFYLLEGYSAVEVGPPEIENRGDRLQVTIPVREGPRQRVVQVVMAGVDTLDAGSLLKQIPLQSGGPFHPRLLEESLAQIRARYEARGYEATQVSPQLVWNDDGTRVVVTLRILEGPRSTVDRVILRGNRRTRTAVIRRTVDLRAGEPLNTSRLLEVQRKLYALGVFNQVEVERAPGTPYSGGRDVLIRVREGAPHRVTYGLGYDSEDGVRGLLGYTHSNLWGRAISGRVDLRASQRDRQARALLRQPFLGRWRLPTTYSLFRIDETEESFDSLRQGGQVEIQRFGRNLRLGLLYTFKRVELRVKDRALEEIELDRDLREVTISSVTPSLLIDRRDDPLDATRGWSVNLQSEYAFPLFGTEAEFLKLFFQHTRYLNLGRLGVVVGSLRIGAIQPRSGTAFQDSTIPKELDSRLIPISERYFAGGRTTHRAYERDRLGIPCETLALSLGDGASQVDQGAILHDDCREELSALAAAGRSAEARLVAVGGNGLLLVNLDYRFPIVGPVGGTVFVDAGNVWADWQHIDPGEVKAGAGFGFRYLSPIGPLRLEAGWKLDREPGEDPFVVQFSFGNPF